MRCEMQVVSVKKLALLLLKSKRARFCLALHGSSPVIFELDVYCSKMDMWSLGGRREGGSANLVGGGSMVYLWFFGFLF